MRLGSALLHPFDKETVSAICAGSWDQVVGLSRWKRNAIIGYAATGHGHFAHDVSRLHRLALVLGEQSDITFAPSVADTHQGRGIGTRLLQYVILQLQGKKRLFLWGGVQITNQRAVRYYLKNDFQIVGEFEYHGANRDMK